MDANMRAGAGSPEAEISGYVRDAAASQSESTSMPDRNSPKSTGVQAQADTKESLIGKADRAITRYRAIPQDDPERLELAYNFLQLQTVLKEGWPEESEDSKTATDESDPDDTAATNGKNQHWDDYQEEFQQACGHVYSVSNGKEMESVVQLQQKLTGALNKRYGSTELQPPKFAFVPREPTTDPVTRPTEQKLQQHIMPAMATKKLWLEETPRQQLALLPRSNVKLESFQAMKDRFRSKGQHARQDRSPAKAQAEESGQRSAEFDSPKGTQPKAASTSGDVMHSGPVATQPTSARKESEEQNPPTAAVTRAEAQVENASNDTEKAQTHENEQVATTAPSDYGPITWTATEEGLEKPILMNEPLHMPTKKIAREVNPRNQDTEQPKSSAPQESINDIRRRLDSRGRQLSQTPRSPADSSRLSVQDDGRKENATENDDVPDPVPPRVGGPANPGNAPTSRLALLQRARSAKHRWKGAPRSSEARSRAFREWTEAESALDEHFPDETESNEAFESSVGDVQASTGLQQKPDVAMQPHLQEIKNYLAVREQQLDQDRRKREAAETRHKSTAKGSGLNSRDQHDQQQNADPADISWGNFLRSKFRSGDDKEDLEAGDNPKKKSGKDEYDVHGRKRIVGKKRDEREQPPKDPKSHYFPEVWTKTEPSYLDRHGRTELQVFQSLVGIYFLANAGAPLPTSQKTLQPASVMSDIFVPSRAAAYRHRNRGLYDRCISQDMKMRVMYSFSHYMISFLYLLQILVAATLTGLSSYTNTAGVALTVLGAINTVLAGILAWLNGQGMPVRYRRARDQFREVVRAIEDAERMFSTIDYMEWAPGTRPTPVGERDRLFKMYEKARQDEEANYPDTHGDADKSEIASNARTFEAKIAKHKKQKKEKSEELKAMQDQVQKLNRKLAGGHTESVTSKSDADDDDDDDRGGDSAAEKLSSSHLKEWADRLDIRQRAANTAMANLAEEKEDIDNYLKAANFEIDKMCSEREVSADKARQKAKQRNTSKGKK